MVPFFSLLDPSFFCFLPSPFLSFPFLSLFYVLFFSSSFSPFFLHFSLFLRPLFLNNHPRQLFPRSPLIFHLLCFLFSILSPVFQIIPSTLCLSLRFVLSFSSPLKKLFNVLSKVSCKLSPLFILPTLVFIRGKREKATLPSSIMLNG